MKNESSHHDIHVRAKLHEQMKFPNTSTTKTIFTQLQKTLTFTPILIHTNFDHEFILYIDIYYKEIAEILHQISIKDNKEYFILYIS